MFKKMFKVIRKVQSFLFGEEIEHIHTREDLKKYYGRIKTEEKAEARMIHEYPKQGKFRFPIIADENHNGAIHKKDETKELGRQGQSQNRYPKKEVKTRQPITLSERKGTTDKRHKSSTQQEVVDLQKKQSNPTTPDVQVRKKFQGVNFKAREIPSPIYAFEKPPHKNKDGENNITNDDVEQHVTVEAPLEIVFEMSDNDKPNHSMVIEPTLVDDSTIATDELENCSEHILLNEEIAATELESVQPTEWISDVTHILSGEINSAQRNDNQLEIGSLVQEHDDSFQQDESEFLEEALQFDETNDWKESSDESNRDFERQDTFENETVLANEDFSEELSDQRLDRNEFSEINQVDSDQYEHQQQQQEEVVKIQADVQSQSDHIEKTAIPFNVLMFHQDRVALKKKSETQTSSYQFPTLNLLNIPPRKPDSSQQWLEEKKLILEDTLMNFNVSAKVVGLTKGPSVTRFEIQPDAGVKVSKVTSLTDDIKLSLAAKDIRMEAPIPGRNAIGIEVPNDISEPVLIREILRSGEFQKNPSPLTVAMGLDIEGKPIVTDIQKMPHGLIAGSTGSGKSVCINSILISIMFKATPDEVKLMLIDPKMVELAPYNDIPHLVTPVITDAKQATIALKWAVEEMERRYELFVQNGVRDIKRFNEVMKQETDSTPALPYIVIVIDELADLMMVSPSDVEEAICRIAQKARACGIHLLVATQRPSVDVITGLIKANIPTRIAFSVSSQADSRTIIDSGGAERLLGKGDMLLFENGASKPLRVQGNFVSDEEIDRVINLVKQQRKPNYLFDREHLVKSYDTGDQEDDLFEEACYFVLDQGGASSSSLQRRFRIGFNRAARLIDMMEARGIISEAMGSKPRNVLVTEEELADRIHSCK